MSSSQVHGGGGSAVERSAYPSWTVLKTCRDWSFSDSLVSEGLESNPPARATAVTGLIS